jgi:asparagine synthase (glutamine-hydrolysing)
MRGIAGCYQQADGQKLTEIITDRIARHRPDASGVWSHHDDRGSVQLGHRRPSIIDLSAAADQPLSKGGLVGREDNAKQIWQLLTMEPWYRNVRSMGVAA